MQATAHCPLLLSSIRRTTQRLWNSVLITADEKRAAKGFYDTHGDDMHKLHALNRRMGALITERTPASQRRAEPVEA